MATLDHGFCGLHKIGYNRTLDYVCPQCVMARITPAKQYDFDIVQQKPVDGAGVALLPAAVVA